MTILDVKNLKKIYTTRFGEIRCRRSPTSAFRWSRANTWPSWASRAREDHAAEHPGRAGQADQRGGIPQRTEHRQIREKEISAFRRDNLGFVFQDFNLLDTFSIQDNIFPSSRPGWKAIQGDGETAQTDRCKAGYRGDFEEISI